MDTLIGKTVHLMISEPWEFGTDHGTGPFEASIIQGNETSLIICLRKPIRYKNANCEYFIAQPRHEIDLLNELKQRQSPSVNFTMISKDKAESENPFDLSLWRGGVALIGTIQLQ